MGQSLAVYATHINRSN